MSATQMYRKNPDGTREPIDWRDGKTWDEKMEAFDKFPNGRLGSLLSRLGDFGDHIRGVLDGREEARTSFGRLLAAIIGNPNETRDYSDVVIQENPDVRADMGTLKQGNGQDANSEHAKVENNRKLATEAAQESVANDLGMSPKDFKTFIASEVKYNAGAQTRTTDYKNDVQHVKLNYEPHDIVEELAKKLNRSPEEIFSILQRNGYKTAENQHGEPIFTPTDTQLFNGVNRENYNRERDEIFKKLEEGVVKPEYTGKIARENSAVSGPWDAKRKAEEQVSRNLTALETEAYTHAASELGVNPAILKKAIRQAGVAASEAEGPQDNDPIAELANRIGKKREDVEKALSHNGFGVEHHNKWKSYAGGGDALAGGYNGISFTPDPAKLYKGVDEKALNWEPPVMGIHPDFADRHGNRLSNEAVEKLSNMAAELNTAGLVGRNQGRVIDSEPQGRRFAQAAGRDASSVMLG